MKLGIPYTTTTYSWEGEGGEERGHVFVCLQKQLWVRIIMSIGLLFRGACHIELNHVFG